MNCDDCNGSTMYPKVMTEDEETYFVCPKCGSENIDYMEQAEEDQ